MPAVECRSCQGKRGFTARSGKWIDCKACQGKGINSDLWQTTCKECWKPIIYKKNDSEPKYCKNCWNKPQNKKCSQLGCSNQIQYKLGHSDVPVYCKRCAQKKREGYTARFCQGQVFMGTCGKLLWVPSGKNYTLCPECSAKAQKANTTERAKTLKTACKGCGSSIEYPARWNNPPDFCDACKQRKIVKKESNQSENKRFDKACGPMGANLTWDEKKRFKEYYHRIPDRKNMSDKEITDLALNWKEENGGGFRRSDKRH